MPADTRSVTFTTTGTVGDLDLFIRFGGFPTLSKFECSSTGPTASESCAITAPQAGTWYLALQAYEPFSDVTVAATTVLGEPVHRRLRH